MGDTVAKVTGAVLFEGDAKRAVQDRIIDEMSEGRTLSEICRQEGMPKRRTVYDWIDADPEFAKQMDRAREIGCDAIADEEIEIADNGSNDWMKRHGKDGAEEWVLNGEHVQRSKLRIWSRQQLRSKWHPKKYGDKTTHEHTGADGERLVFEISTSHQPSKPKEE